MLIQRRLFIVVILLLLFSIPVYAGGSQKEKIILNQNEISLTNPFPALCIGSNTTTGYKELQVNNNGQLKVEVINSDTVGTTTSNIHGWTGTAWEKTRIDANGFLLPKSPVASDFKVEATITQTTNNRINTSKMSGLSSIVYTSTTALTNQVLIAPAVGKILYIYGITFFNRGLTKGNVNFYWDSAGTILCYPAFCPAESGFGDSDMYRVSASGQGLYVTTPDACAIIVYYLQQ